jgi:hypothetical protein
VGVLQGLAGYSELHLLLLVMPGAVVLAALPAAATILRCPPLGPLRWLLLPLTLLPHVLVLIIMVMGAVYLHAGVQCLLTITLLLLTLIMVVPGVMPPCCCGCTVAV